MKNRDIITRYDKFVDFI